MCHRLRLSCHCVVARRRDFRYDYNLLLCMGALTDVGVIC